jgi:hypothetical protein
MFGNFGSDFGARSTPLPNSAGFSVSGNHEHAAAPNPRQASLYLGVSRVSRPPYLINLLKSIAKNQKVKPVTAASENQSRLPVLITLFRQIHCTVQDISKYFVVL